MNTSNLTDAQLLQTTRRHLQRSHELDADLLQLLGEICERRLYLERGFDSMFAFCRDELGLSEDVTCNRMVVARLARSFPRVLDFVREGRVHLTGLRLLAPVVTQENLEEVLTAASGKSKREIEELAARLAPQPPVPTTIRKLPQPRPAVVEEEPPSLPLAGMEAPAVETPPAPVLSPPAREARRPEVKPLSAEDYRVQFTASRRLKEKLEQAEELLRHRVGPGNLEAILELALDLLIAEEKKERFGVGRKPRTTAAEAEQREDVTRHIPAAIRREVHERDEGQCTFVAEDGRRCQERGGLEFDHVEGFARTGRHSVEGLRLVCRAHNQHLADKMYGREFMEAKRRGARPGTGGQGALL